MLWPAKKCSREGVTVSAKLPGRWYSRQPEGYRHFSQTGRPLAALIFLLWVSIPGLSSADSPAERAYSRATHAIASGDYGAAAADLRVSIQLEPDRAPFQFAYAYALSRLGETEPARAAITKCLKLKPDYPGALLLAGDIESDMKNFSSAVGYLEKAHDQEPNNVDVLSSLGLAFVGLGRYDHAATQFRAVTRLRPDFASGHYNLGLALLNIGKASEAETEFRQVLKLSPDSQKAQMQLGSALVVQGRDGNREKTRDAVEVYRQILKSNPHNLDSHFGLGFALSLLRDDQGALAEYQEVAQVNSDYPLVQFSLGFTEYHLKDYQNAANHLRKALDQGTDNYFVRYCLGSALLQTGDRVTAKAHLETAVKMDPKDPGPHFQLAKLYGAVGDAHLQAEEYGKFRGLSAQRETEWHINALQKFAADALETGQTEKGIDTLKEVYSARHDVTSARNLGLAYLRSGKIEDARHYLEESLKLSPRDAATHNYLGLLEARDGDLAGAQKEFEKAANLDSSFPDALYNAGVSSYQLRQVEIAIKYFRAALARFDTPQVHRALALALADAGQADEAQQQLEDAQKPR